MSDDRELVERLAAIDATPRAGWVAELRAHLDAAFDTEDAGYLDAVRTTTVTLVDIEPTPSEPASGRRWPILFAAAATVVVAIALVATRDDNATPADQPSATVSATVSPAAPPAWSPELTAQVLTPRIGCNRSAVERKCPGLAVSPDGTLVSYDYVAATLTWYEDEPRVVSLAPKLTPSALFAIGPHDIAYVLTPGYIVAFAPSGAEITRTIATNKLAYPTATGLVQIAGSGCLSVNAAPTIPWVDLDGKPITDTTPYPSAMATDAGIEVRLGEREWLLADEEAGNQKGRLNCLDLRPRSDGGVVIVLDTFVPGHPPRINLLELSPDGSIERYFVDGLQLVLPDGSLIVEHNVQLVRLTPPA